MGPLELAREFRRALLRHDLEAETYLIRAYAGIHDSIKRRLSEFGRLLADAEASGAPIRASWLYEQSRLSTLQRQLELEISRYAGIASNIIPGYQVNAIHLAQAYAAEAITSGGAGIEAAFNRLPLGAIQSLIGRLRDGTPTAEYLARLAPAYNKHIESILIEGIATGRGASSIAKRLVESSGIPRNKAMSVARDSILGAYRDAAIEHYRLNTDVVNGWIWLAALGSACATCTAMHGTVHDLSESFASHSRCRCAPVALTDKQSRMQAGVEWFSKQPAEIQRKVLPGNAAYKAYRAGAVSLDDFVGVSSRSDFGPSRYTKSLKQILGADKARQFYAN